MTIGRIGQAVGRNVNMCPNTLTSRKSPLFFRALLSTWEVPQADDMGPGEGCVTGLCQAQSRTQSKVLTIYDVLASLYFVS